MVCLAREDLEVVAIEGNMLDNLVGWEILACVRNERVDRAIELIVGTMPVQTIVSAFIADQFLCELLRKGARRACKILFLRTDQFAARIHGGKFISTYAAEYDLVFPGVGVEIPRTVVVHQGNRKRPVFGPNNQRDSSARFSHEPMHLLVFDNESRASIRIFRWVAGREDLLTGSSEGAPRDPPPKLHGPRDEKPRTFPP